MHSGVHPGINYSGSAIPCPGSFGICAVAPIDAATDGQQGCTMTRDEECSPEHVANKSHNIVTLELLQVGTISLELPYGFIWFWC